MKRIVSLFLILALCLSLCSCEQNHTINGYYEFNSLKHRGLDYTPKGAENSYILVTPDEDNLLASMIIRLGTGTEYCYISGHLQEYTNEEDIIKYKFWLSEKYGSIPENIEYLPIDYTPDTNTVVIASDEYELAFSHAKEQKTEKDLVDALEADLQGEWWYEMPHTTEEFYFRVKLEFSNGTCTLSWYDVTNGTQTLADYFPTSESKYAITPGAIVVKFSEQEGDNIVLLCSYENNELMLYETVLFSDNEVPAIFQKGTE